jgi:hypothetical protein
MNIEEFLSIDSSRLNADLLVEKFEEDTSVFETILSLMYQDTYPLSMRAGRVVWLIGGKYPDYVQPYLPEMIDKLPKFKVEGVRRNILALIEELPLPGIDPGALFDYCYTALENEKEPISVRGYSITILHKISDLETSLKPELINFFESMLPSGSAGIETRLKHTLSKLYKEIGLVNQ